VAHDPQQKDRERLTVMQTRVRKLVGYGALGLAVAVAGASCRDERELQKGPTVTIRERHVVAPATEEIMLGGELTGIMVERAPVKPEKPETRRTMARREPEVVPPLIEPRAEPTRPEVTPSPEIVPERRVAPRPPPRAELPPEAPERSNAAAIRTALAVGIAGMAAGATAAGASDGTTGDTVVTTSFLGIGLAGLATAGILQAMEPAKPVKVTFGPGMIGVRGTF
jgi:hypothetical protein